MPALIAAPWLGTAIAGVAGGTAAVVGAKMSSNASTKGAQMQTDAATRAAQMQTEAANHAADLQKQASDATLAYTKEQDALAASRAEVDRRANFDQYQSRARGAQSLGDALGFHVNLPDYVPGNNPTSTAAAGPAPKVSDAGDASQIAAYFKSRGVSDQETPYWVSKWPELVARGKELGNPNYANERLAAAEIFGGGGGAAAPRSNTIASYLAPQAGAAAFLNPSQAVLQAPPPGAYQPQRNTISAYLGGRA